jgi:mRNA interferase RelE/StbE
MASYKIVLKPSLQKDLHPVPKATLARIIQHIEGLKEEPLPRQSVKLAGAVDLYRIRVGDYRVIYEIDREAQEVIILYVRHRKEAYRGK